MVTLEEVFNKFDEIFPPIDEEALEDMTEQELRFFVAAAVDYRKWLEEQTYEN